MSSPSSFIRKLEDNFDCPICCEVYDQDTRLPMMICAQQHSVCLRCLGSNNFQKCYLCYTQINKNQVKKFRLLNEIRKTAAQLKKGSILQRQSIKKRQMLQGNIKELNEIIQKLEQNIQQQKQMKQWLIQNYQALRQINQEKIQQAQALKQSSRYQCQQLQLQINQYRLKYQKQYQINLNLQKNLRILEQQNNRLKNNNKNQLLIANSSKDEILLKKSYQSLQQLLKPIKIDHKLLINSILQQSLLINALRSQLSKKQFYHMITILQSQQISNIKKQIKIQKNYIQPSININLKKQQFQQIFKQIKYNFNNLFQTIINNDNIDNIIIQINKKLNGKDRKKLQLLLKCKRLLYFKQNLQYNHISLYKIIKQKYLSQLSTYFHSYHQIQIKYLIQNILYNQQQLIQYRIHHILQSQLNGYQMEQLYNIIKSQSIINLQKQIKNYIQQLLYQQYIINNRYQIYQQYSSFNINTEILVNQILSRIDTQPILHSYKNIMNFKQYKNISYLTIQHTNKIKNLLNPPNNIHQQFHQQIQIQLQQLFKQIKQIKISQLIPLIMEQQPLYNKIQSILTSQQIINIKSKIKDYKERIKKQNQLTNTLEIFNFEVRPLAEAIVRGNIKQQQAQIQQLSELLCGKEFIKLNHLINNDFKKYRPSAIPQIDINKLESPQKMIKIQPKSSRSSTEVIFAKKQILKRR